MFNVLTAEFLHETNTFCQLPTTLASFAERGLRIGTVLHGVFAASELRDHR